MSKRTSANQAYVKTNTTDTSRGAKHQLIEMAAERLADLLWKCWQARSTTKKNKRTKSGSQPNRPGSP